MSIKSILSFVPIESGEHIMPLDIMLLEERIVLDGAGGAVVADAVLPPDSDAADAAHDTEGADLPGDAGDVNDAGQEQVQGDNPSPESLALAADAITPASGQHVLVISTNVENYESLAAAAGDDILTVIYDGDDASLESILAQIENALGGQKAESIAFAAHDLGAGKMHLVGEHVLSTGVLFNATSMQDFWIGIADNLSESGRIDLLACDLAANTEGELLVAALENFTGRDVAASTDLTGNTAAGGDWMLETDGIDAAGTYFTSDIENFLGTLTGDAKLTADEVTYGDFGNCVAISGDYAIVGEYYNFATIFYNDGTGWAQQAKLATIGFIESVDINDDYAIIGASKNAYIFNRSGASWNQQAKLTASDGAASDSFGYSVSIRGDYALVGAFQNDDNGTNSGSAYVFKRSGTNWTEQAKLNASDGAAEDNFGRFVSISGDYAIIGAFGDDDNGSYSGSAYIFTRSGGIWTQQAKLTASDGMMFDYFGKSVSISGDYVVVGAESGNGKVSNSGSAYVFVRSGNSWSQQAKLIASDGAKDDNFGSSVSISGDYVIIGAKNEDAKGTDSGSAYVFKRSGTSWIQQNKLTAADGRSEDHYGASVSVSGDNFIIGSPKDDDGGTDSGSAYVERMNITPEATNLTQTQNYTEDTTVALDNIVVTDPDTGEQITAELTLMNRDTGTLTATSGNGETYVAATGLWSITGTVAKVNAALAAVTFEPTANNEKNSTIKVNIKDGLEWNSTAQTGTISLNVTPVNDQPATTELTYTANYTEGDAIVSLDNMGVNDPDSGEQITATLKLTNTATGTLTATSGSGETYDATTGEWSITGTLAEVNEALVAVAFVPTSDNDVNTTIAVSIQDGLEDGSVAQTGTITLNVTPANDQPSATNLTQTQNYTEGDASVALNNIVVTDPDTGEQITAKLTLVDTAAGALTVASGNGETYDATTGEWTITGTVAEVNAALAAVAFVPEANNEVSTTVAVNIEDGLEADSVAQTGTITLNVTTENDQPSATNLTQTQNYNEGAASVALDDIVVSDPDSDEQVTAELTLENAATGALSTDNGATYNSTTGVWSITGTVAEVNVALAAVAFTPATNNEANTTVTVNIHDGQEDGSVPQIGTITLNVTAVNDQPSATNLTQAQSFNSADNSVDLDDIVVSDPDTGEQVTVILTLSDAAQGSLTTTSGKGETYTAGTGVWTVTGTVADVNAALAAVAFEPVDDLSEEASVTVSITDGGEDGSLAQTGTIDLKFVPEPDAAIPPPAPLTSPEKNFETGPEFDDQNSFGDLGLDGVNLDFETNPLRPIGQPIGDMGDGPGAADADLDQVLQALETARTSLNTSFGNQPDPLSVTPAPASSNQAPARDQGTSDQGDRGQQDALQGSGQSFFQTSLLQLSTEVSGLQFNSQQPEFSVTSLEGAVAQLAQLADEVYTSRNVQANTALLEMAAELAAICEQCAQEGQPVAELLEQLNATQQLLSS
jgi:hypothetical protein